VCIRARPSDSGAPTARRPQTAALSPAAAGQDTAALEEKLAGLQGQRDTVFKGETLRAILLNAYGWWTVGTITLYAGFGMVLAGVVLAILAGFGFRHARKVT
jgi:hypothetical protein